MRLREFVCVCVCTVGLLLKGIFLGSAAATCVHRVPVAPLFVIPSWENRFGSPRTATPTRRRGVKYNIIILLTE